MPGSGNVISGNSADGVSIIGTRTSPNTELNQVQGNYIGTNGGMNPGTQPLGNLRDGVSISVTATSNTIGGTAAAARNIISGNLGNGIEINGSGTRGNAVEGNYVGSDISGTTAVANAIDGVAIINASNNTIGGINDLNPDGTIRIRRGNAVSGNGGNGVSVSNATDVFIVGNFIGTDASGTQPVRNTADGVLLDSAPNNFVGQPGAGNLISGNGLAGVEVRNISATVKGNVIQSNYIGTDTTGKAALANLVGVFINGAPGTRSAGPTPPRTTRSPATAAPAASGSAWRSLVRGT